MASAPSDPFRPIANPYIVGNPIEDRRMFFGREDDFAYIRQKVTGGEKGGLLVLCGTRRSGKTSILFQIKGGQLGEDFVPVLVDMQAMTVQDDQEFLVKLTQEIIATIRDPRLEVYETELRARAHKNPYTIFQALIKELDTALKGKKLVLMFDEYELFETHIDKGRISTDILNLLANWMESRRGVFIVFTGSDILEARNSRYWQAFLGKALHRKISFLTKGDTLRLIREPLRGEVEHQETVPEQIYLLTAGQPFYSQVLCQSLIDHLNEKMKYLVSGPDLQEAVAEIIENPLPQMIFTWSSLTPLEKTCLSIIAERSREQAGPVTGEAVLSYPRQEKLGYQLVPAKVHEALERLFHYDLLDKDAAGEGYSFKMDLWRQWMLRMHSIWQVLDEIGPEVERRAEGIRRHAGRGRRTGLLALGAVLLLAAASPFLYRTYFATTPPATGRPLAALAHPDSALLVVDTDPQGAEVFWGDLRLGTAPLGGRRVLAGQAVLRIDLLGYKVHTDTLAPARDETLRVPVTLVEKRGSLRVTSTPPGARISLDGRDLDRATPARIDDLSVNRRHRLDLSLPGYHSGSLPNLEVLADDTALVHHPFAQITHPLTIHSRPQGAQVRFDGEPLGPTPRILQQVSQGRHRVEIRQEGFETDRRTIDIPAPDNSIEIVLRPLPPGVLTFQIEPFAAIWINGVLREEIGVSFTDTLPPGTYQCRLVHPNYQDHAETVELGPGDRKLVQFNFFEQGSRR